MYNFARFYGILRMLSYLLISGFSDKMMRPYLFFL